MRIDTLTRQLLRRAWDDEISDGDRLLLEQADYRIQAICRTASELIKAGINAGQHLKHTSPNPRGSCHFTEIRRSSCRKISNRHKYHLNGLQYLCHELQ